MRGHQSCNFGTDAKVSSSKWQSLAFIIWQTFIYVLGLVAKHDGEHTSGKDFKAEIISCVKTSPPSPGFMVTTSFVCAIQK